MKQNIQNILKKDEDQIIDFIKNNKEFDINSKDNNGNYFLQLIIINNYFKVFQFIIKNLNNVDFDILDNDLRSILYYIIKLDRTEFIDIIIDNIHIFLGFPILELKDKDGNFSLFYCVLFNNIHMFKKIYKSNIDIFKTNNIKESILHFAIKNKNSQIINFLIDNDFPLDILNKNNESIAHYFITFYKDFKNITQIIKKLNLTFKDTNFGLTPYHLLAINIPDILLELDIKQNINSTDFYGNTPINYLIIEKHFHIFEKIFLKYYQYIYFDNLNINSDTLLHLYLQSNNIKQHIIKTIIQHTNLDLQNNQGNTPIHLIIKYNLDLSLLQNKLYNIFIINNNSQSPLQIYKNKKQLFDITANNISNYLNNNKKLATTTWEKNCIKNNNCKNIILQYLNKEQKNPPFTQIDFRKIIIDNNVPIKQCQYAGINLDILFGLIFLRNNTKINIILEHPLTYNQSLTQYFNNIGIDISYKIDFINIQIYWAYQQLILPSFLKNNKDFNNIIKNKGYTIIPLGIEIKKGGHANVLLFNHNNKTIERFEPQGANPPMEFNYNPQKLDYLLEDTFKKINYKYIKPKEYLPVIGLQYLESLELESCNIGDPNGFCAIWCVWWVYHRMLNDIDSKILINKLIHKIKLQNYSFKNLIRNFSSRITDIRDKYLKQNDLDINLWIQGKYNEKNINKLIKDINVL